MLLDKVVVARIEGLDVLENLEVSNTAVEHCFRPGSSSTLQLEKSLQLRPELGLPESLWFLWVFDLSSFGTPGSLSHYLDENVTAHRAPGLIAR